VEQATGDTELARFDSNGNQTIDFEEVIYAIAAFNNDQGVGGQKVTFSEVIDIIAAFNNDTTLR